jgi:hypothetical protein
MVTAMETAKTMEGPITAMGTIGKDRQVEREMEAMKDNLQVAQ